VRVKCETPDMYVVDAKLEQTIRLIGIYASKSKTWAWDILSHYITYYCILLDNTTSDQKSLLGLSNIASEENALGSNYIWNRTDKNR
jgi:hypothetical protein